MKDSCQERQYRRVSMKPPPWTANTTSGYIGLSVAKNGSTSGLTWSAETSDDLTNWHPEQTMILVEDSTTFSARYCADECRSKALHQAARDSGALNE